MTIGEKKKRKQRSDRKRDIKPYLNLEIRDGIHRLSYILSMPIKDICEKLLLNSLYGNKDIIQDLSIHFKRGIRINNTYFNGNLNNEKLYSVADGKTERVSLRVKGEVYEVLSALAYGFDVSVSRVAAVFIYESILDGAFVEKLVEEHLETLDKYKKKELKTLLKYIQTEKGDSYSLADLLSFLVDEPIRWSFPD